MAYRFIRAHTFGFADTIGRKEGTLTTSSTGCEECQMLGIQFTPQWARIRVVRFNLAALGKLVLEF